MAKIGTVWDRTTDVVGGRMAMLATIGGLALFLPAVIANAWSAYSVPPTHMTTIVALILSIIVLVVSIWGQLAILSIATDPATTQGGATAQASARLLPALGVGLALLVLFSVLASPIAIALAATGYDFSAAMANQTSATMSPGTGIFVICYGLVLVILLLWLGARLMLVNPVVLNERLGLGAIRRSIVLTRGHTWKLIGLILLLAIVLFIAGGAAQLITGVVLRLILGADSIPTVTFLAALVGQIVTTGFTVVAIVFTAQLYLALRGPVAPPE